LKAPRDQDLLKSGSLEAKEGTELPKEERVAVEEVDGTEEDDGRTVVGVGFGVGSSSENVRSVLIEEKDGELGRKKRDGGEERCG
ncbi:hypothetical protein PIB30_085274, partial [Stylosanthes scabra]|nr:hypothetical protein [Stylosanthes scabra]